MAQTHTRARDAVDGAPTLTRRGLLGVAGGLGLTALTPLGRIEASGDLDEVAPKRAVPTTDNLAVTGPHQPRWLSVPMSRVVVNPYDFNQSTSEVAQNSGPQLPLSAGYFAYDEAVRLPSLLAVYRRPGGEPDPQPPPEAFSDEFDELDPAWSAEPGVSASVAESRLTMVLPDSAPNPWGALSRQLTLDVDTFPLVSIAVIDVDGAWALKVNDGSSDVDTVLQADTTVTGTFTYDLRQLTGWSGRKTFTLRLFVVQKQAPLLVDRIAVHGRPTTWLQAATTYTSTWRPEALDFTAEYAGGGSLRGYDVFHDTTSVTRVLVGTGLDDDGGGLALAGRFAGDVQYDAARGVLTVSQGNVRYAVAVGAGRQVTYYRSELDLLVGGPALPEPPATGFWAVAIPAGGTTVGIGFAHRGEGAEVAAERARAAASPSAAPRARVRWRDYWNAYLARVPRPADFTLTAVPTEGVTADDIAATYYRAWHFLYVNTLPEMPEIDYPFPQVATGKPSMWAFGAEGSRPSASWDSLLGMQYLAYVEPDVAWRAFLGLMSLVDNTGRLGGESLPSRKAQTAWILYNVTGDAERLAACYEALRRYLLWARDNPRWIFGDHDIPDERDAEFVVSLLLDFGYAARIAATLGRDDEGTFWQEQAEALTADYGAWFFPVDGPYRTLQYHFVEGSHPDSPGNTLWVCTGLHLPRLTERQRRLLIDRFLSEYRPDATLAGWGFPNVKAPDVSYTAYGLLDSGMVREADVFLQANLRDVVRAGVFAEVYDNPPDGPVGVGVRPSLFGAVTVIDVVWLRNGYRADDGEPLFVRMPDADGGLSGLTFRGRRLAVDIDAAAGEVRLSGNAVRGGRRYRRLPAPVGESLPIPDGCAMPTAGRSGSSS